MERCPSCRARWDGGEYCRRCQMELSHLLGAEQAAMRLMRRAIIHLAADDSGAALADLRAARALVADPLTDWLLGFARARHRELGRRHRQAVAQALRHEGLAAELAAVLGE